MVSHRVLLSRVHNWSVISFFFSPLHLWKVLGGTWAQCLMDVTPAAIVSEGFVRALPAILQTKASDMVDGGGVKGSQILLKMLI